MKRIEKKAYGKINLSLDVVGKREDGYHLVRMIMQTVDIWDRLTIERADHGEIRLQIQGSDLSAGPDNLVCRAAKAMQEAFGLEDGFDSTLEKHIPAAAGMAGGSADAAIGFLKARGVQKIIFLCILAAPDGVERLQKNHPDVDIYAAAYDGKLNENGYIVPGLGDAGDRIFGTK